WLEPSQAANLGSPDRPRKSSNAKTNCCEYGSQYFTSKQLTKAILRTLIGGCLCFPFEFEFQIILRLCTGMSIRKQASARFTVSMSVRKRRIVLSSDSFENKHGADSCRYVALIEEKLVKPFRRAPSFSSNTNQIEDDWTLRTYRGSYKQILAKNETDAKKDANYKKYKPVVPPWSVYGLQIKSKGAKSKSEKKRCKPYDSGHPWHSGFSEINEIGELNPLLVMPYGFSRTAEDENLKFSGTINRTQLSYGGLHLPWIRVDPGRLELPNEVKTRPKIYQGFLPSQSKNYDLLPLLVRRKTLLTANGRIKSQANSLLHYHQWTRCWEGAQNCHVTSSRKSEKIGYTWSYGSRKALQSPQLEIQFELWNGDSCTVPSKKRVATHDERIKTQRQIVYVRMLRNIQSRHAIHDQIPALRTVLRFVPVYGDHRTSPLNSQVLLQLVKSLLELSKFRTR
ncbi:unnamed protein product, partial [Nesidiocoris tenuis]